MRCTCHGFSFALLLGAVVVASPALAGPTGKVIDGNGTPLDALITKHAAAYNLPESLLRRVIKRESRGNPRLISKGNYGLMQIRLGTARAMGYHGDIAGLLDADTNMTYAVKYLAGAYQAAEGNADRAVHYYAAGFYYVAKRKGMAMPTTATVTRTAAKTLAKSAPNTETAAKAAAVTAADAEANEADAANAETADVEANAAATEADSAVAADADSEVVADAATLQTQSNLSSH